MNSFLPVVSPFSESRVWEFFKNLGSKFTQLPLSLPEWSNDRAHFQPQMPSSQTSHAHSGLAPRLVVPTSRAADSLEGKTVILAEDDESNRAMMLMYLGDSWGMKVLEAGDGAQVLEHLQNCPHVDLILMDMQMPVLDGAQAAASIRAGKWAYRNIPILALTGNPNSENIEAARATGMNDFMLKSGDMRLLREKMVALLACTDHVLKH